MDEKDFLIRIQHQESNLWWLEDGKKVYGKYLMYLWNLPDFPHPSVDTFFFISNISPTFRLPYPYFQITSFKISIKTRNEKTFPSDNLRLESNETALEKNIKRKIFTNESILEIFFQRKIYQEDITWQCWTGRIPISFYFVALNLF